MKKRDKEWRTWRVRGRVTEVWCADDGEVVLIGQPDNGDEDHDCDAVGCGQDHVLWRARAKLEPKKASA